MPGLLDFLYLALFAAAWPVYEHLYGWPRFLRRLQAHPEHARLRAYRETLAEQWLLVGAGLALWLHAGRPWSDLGLRAPPGWRLWAAVTAVLLLAGLYASQAAKLARSARSRARVRERIGSVEALVPHTAVEFLWFVVLSLTAGVCEEFMFRGFLIWALSPTLGFWGAAAAGAPVFGLAHAYQGRAGIVRTGVVGAVLTLVYAVTDSLLPAMALHALVDVGSGLLIWIALRDRSAPDDAPEVVAQA